MKLAITMQINLDEATSPADFVSSTTARIAAAVSTTPGFAGGLEVSEISVGEPVPTPEVMP